MNRSGCKNCPVKPCETLYRGSICLSRRHKLGLGDPMTNADRIRAMSDEEIADWVSENGAIKTPCDIICGGDCKAIATIEKSSIERCKEIVMKWLQQPAEDDHDERKEHEHA